MNASTFTCISAYKTCTSYGLANDGASDDRRLPAPPVGVSDGPGQGGYTSMHARCEGRGVDVILDQQDLCLCVLIPDRPQLPHIVTHRLQRVSLPAIYNHDNPLPS